MSLGAEVQAEAVHRELTPGERATARLLWHASRPWPDPDAIVELLDGDADVETAGAIAHASQTGPLVWSALESVARTHDLGRVRDSLERDYHLHRGRAALLLPTAVAATVGPLTRAGLEPVIVKGPALAARYPELGLRPMDDLDVLLPPEQFDTAMRALIDDGWCVLRGVGREHPYDAVLLHESIPHLPIEVHRGLASWREHTNRLSARGLWRARVPIDCLGTAAFGLPPEDELVFLCAHAGKPSHHFARLIWAVDLAVLLRDAGTRFDWDRVARTARRVGCTTVVAVGLIHARRLGAPVPDELIMLPETTFRRAALAPVLDESWAISSADSEAIHHRMNYALTDFTHRRALLFLGEVFEDGWRGAPARGPAALGRVVRRWGRWRRTGSLAGPSTHAARSTRPPRT